VPECLVPTTLYPSCTGRSWLTVTLWTNLYYVRFPGMTNPLPCRGTARSLKCARYLCSWSQPPLVLQPAFDGLEHQAIDQIPNDDNQNHHRNHLTHVIQIAPHHEQLS
jgi:hypothetical protein